MQMDNSLSSSINELIELEKQQLQRMNDMTLQQAEQTNMQRQQTMRAGDESAHGQPRSYAASPYAMHSTNYMPPGLNVADSLSPKFQQFGAYAQDLKANATKYGFVDTFMPGSNVSHETRNMLTQDYAGRTANAAISGTGAAASTVATLGAYGLTGSLVGGMALGAAGGALVGAFFDNGLEQAKIQQSYSKYLQRESYRFINARESNNDRGFGGFSLGESQEVADYMKNVNTELYIKDDEMMTLLQKYTESGMLRDVQDMEEFKDKIKGLTKNVKSGALMLNETYESIADLMSEMKKMGISENSYGNLMSMGKIVGTELGVSGSEAVRNILGMSQGMVQGTGLSSEQYTNRLNDTVLYTNYMYEGLKNQSVLDPKELATKNFVNNSGGVQNVSMMINQMQDSMLFNFKDIAAGFFDYDESKSSWVMNKDKFNKLTSGEYSLTDLYGMGTDSVLRYDDYTQKDWQDNFKIYLGNELDQSQISKFTTSLATAHNRSIGNDPADLSMGLSMMMPDMSADQRALYSNYLDVVSSQGDELMMKQRNMAASENISALIKSNNPTIFEDMKYGWENLKQGMGAWGVDVSNFFSGEYQKLNDLIYGKHFYDVNFKSGNTNWTSSGLAENKEEFYGTVKDVNSVLNKLKTEGYSVDDDIISLFGITQPDSKTAPEISKVKDNYKAGSSVPNFNKINRMYDDATTAYEKYFAAKLDEGSVGVLGESYIVNDMSPYEREVYDALTLMGGSNGSVYLNGEMEDGLLKSYAEMNNLSVPDGPLSRGDKVTVKRDMMKWYKGQYSDIENFVAGKDSKWGDLDTSSKTQLLKFMQLVSGSTIGDDLGLGDIGELVGDDFALAFNAKDIEFMSKIDKDGVYDANYKGKNKNAYERMLKWIGQGAPMDYSSMGFGKDDVDGIMGLTMGEAEKKISEQLRVLEREMVTNENGNISIEDLELIEKQMSSILSFGDQAEDLSRFGELIPKMFPQVDEKSFKREMDYKTLSNENKIKGMSIEEIRSAVESASAAMVDTVSGVIETDMTGFIDGMNQQYDPQLTETYLSAFGVFDDDGSFVVDKDKWGGDWADKMAEALVNVLASTTEGDATGGVQAAGNDKEENSVGRLESSSDNFVKAVDGLSDKLDTTADTITRVNRKIDDVAAEVSALKTPAWRMPWGQ